MDENRVTASSRVTGGSWGVMPNQLRSTTVRSLHTFNPTSHVRYRPPVAKVYASDRGVPFWRVFKTEEAATRCALRFNGIVFNLR